MFLDFIKLEYFLVGYGITLIISLKTYGKYFDTVLKYLPIIIAYTFLNELLGYFIRYHSDFSLLFKDLKDASINEIIYNIYDIIFFPFFYYIYWQLVSNLTYKKYIFRGAIIALLSYVVSCFFQNPVESGLYYAYAIASLILIFCIAMYFYDKYLNKTKLLQPYNLVFWISSGLLIFHFFSPIFLIVGDLDYDTWELYNLRISHNTLIVIMYTLFCIGFIIGRKKEFK